ncbi:MAG: hypothetical protein IT228_00470 [Flavobacteriales bacterium]|nr:hypothetical protein [Flavobacteriales bacterium]MCC6575793.1 hypothetical protein [Flavobacteriales bacterium]NUQ13966.1 hypothetical protein [Flavobacteriales bacterium]
MNGANNAAGDRLRGTAALAHALSVVLHPVFMPLLTLVLAFRLDPHISFFLPPPVQWFTFGMVAVMTVLFPLSSAVILWRSGAISSLTMPRRQERIAPLTMTLLYLAMALYLLHRGPHHPATLALFHGVLLAVAATLVVTLRWRISAHMVGIGGLLGGLSALQALHGTFAPLELAGIIVLAGALGSARMLVGDHTAAQVGAGTALGFFSTWACVLFGTPA